MAASKVLFSASEDEILVEMVAKFPCLYDLACPTYKDQVVKDNAWKEVAEAVARSVDDSKKRWRNVKDTYQKRQKRMGTGSSASSKPKKWMLADMLSFLDQTDRKRKTISNIETVDFSNMEEDIEIKYEEEEPVEADEITNDNTNRKKTSSSTTTSIQKEDPPSKNSPAPPSSKRPKLSDKLVGLLEKRRNERIGMFKSLSQNHEDEIDLFFKSIAMTVKKLRPELISEAKLKTLQIVCELETRNSNSYVPQQYHAAPVSARTFVSQASNNTSESSPAGSSADYFSDPPS